MKDRVGSFFQRFAVQVTHKDRVSKFVFLLFGVLVLRWVILWVVLLRIKVCKFLNVANFIRRQLWSNLLLQIRRHECNWVDILLYDVFNGSLLLHVYYCWMLYYLHPSKVSHPFQTKWITRIVKVWGLCLRFLYFLLYIYLSRHHSILCIKIIEVDLTPILKSLIF